MTNVLQINQDLVRWSRKRWIISGLLVLGVQIGALFWMSGRTATAPVGHTGLPHVWLNPNGPLINEGIEHEDPMLFAAAHPKGFSGLAWMFPPRWKYSTDGLPHPPSYIEFLEARRLMPQPGLQETFPKLTDRNFFAASPPTPILLSPATDQKSYLEVEGEIADRSILTPLELPVQTHSDVLGNSVVEVGVSAEGFVISARLLQGSGSKKADLEAITLSRNLRFAPKPTSNNAEFQLAVGKLIFHWFGLSLGNTNGPSR